MGRVLMVGRGQPILMRRQTGNLRLPTQFGFVVG